MRVNRWITRESISEAVNIIRTRVKPRLCVYQSETGARYYFFLRLFVVGVVFEVVVTVGASGVVATIASVVVDTVASVIVVGGVVKRKFVRVHFCGESASRDIK